MKSNDKTPSGALPTTGTVDSRLGLLGFEGGYPTPETVARLYDELDFQRAVQVYLWAVPLVSFAQWQEEYENVFGQQDGDLVLTTSFRDKLGLLTANDTTPYVVGFLNLQRTGPLVIDYPKGQSAGGILDFWQRPITDLGLTGPDQGEGGKYLVLAPGQEAPRDVSGYRVVQSPRTTCCMVCACWPLIRRWPRPSWPGTRRTPGRNASVPARHASSPRKARRGAAGPRARWSSGGCSPRCSTKSPCTSATA